MKKHMMTDYKRLARYYYGGSVFLAFDTETTGLRCKDDQLLEIGAVKFNKDGLIGEPFDALIKPPVPIPPFITDLTHITEEMVKDKPPVKNALWGFLSYIGDSNVILLAHNAPFDLGFVQTNMEKANLGELKNKTVDTLPLSRWAYPELAKNPEKGQYKLQSLAKTLEINVIEAHRASDDARVCMELFKRIIKDKWPEYSAEHSGQSNSVDSINDSGDDSNASHEEQSLDPQGSLF